MIFGKLHFFVLAVIICLGAIKCTKKSTPMKKSDSSTEQSSVGFTKVNSSLKVQQNIVDYVLYEKGAVSFREKVIPSDILETILKTITPYTSLSRWKLIVVRKKNNRIKVLEAMQSGFQKLGQDRLAEIMDRWKIAPLLLVFCIPKTIEAFGGVPPDMVQPQAHIELGMGVQGLMLVARTYGVETHWIAGALLVNWEIKNSLKIPGDYDVIFFGVAGYPSEEIIQEFPPLNEVCYTETWGKPF